MNEGVTMSKKVIIASDSTCDLSPELIEHYGIRIIPLGVTLSDKSYKDGVDMDPDTIYRHYEETGELPKTAAINIDEAMAFIASLKEEGEGVVFFTISSDMSSTFQNARLAAGGFEDVHVVDSRNLSTGIGLQVLRAARLAEEGKSAAEIATECEALCDRVDASFVVDDLEFLHKGGRCSALAAFGANLLQLKPCIVVKGGKMGVDKKYRGKYGMILPKYIAERLGDGSDVEGDTVFVTHAGCDEAIVNACVEKVKSLGYFKEIHVTRAGCTISSHCGRNTLGVLFIRKNPII